MKTLRQQLQHDQMRVATQEMDNAKNMARLPTGVDVKLIVGLNCIEAACPICVETIPDMIDILANTKDNAPPMSIPSIISEVMLTSNNPIPKEDISVGGTTGVNNAVKTTLRLPSPVLVCF